MAYTAQQLITRSFYLSGIISREFETPSGSQIQIGLDTFNSLLDWLSIETQALPFFKLQPFIALQGVEKYFIPNLFEIEDLTFTYSSNVRWPSSYQSRSKYFGTFRANNVSTLPFSFRPERTIDGMDIYLYPIPNQNYEMTIVGKFGLRNVTLQTDLSTEYDQGYLEYLRYLLAPRLCDEFGGSLPETTERRISEMKTQLMYLTGRDLTCNKTSVFSRQNSLNWGMVNLYRGLLPPC